MARVGAESDVRPAVPARPSSPATRRDDLVLAGVLGLAGLVEIALTVPAEALVAVASLLVMTGAVAVRRRQPTLSLVLVLAALAAQTSLGVPVNAQLMTMPFIVLAAYSVGTHLDRRASAIGLGIGVVLVSVAIAAAGTGGSDFGFGLLIVTAPWIAGVLMRARRTAEVEALAGAETRARQSAEEERDRIARELHDIVSHGLSAMVVQAAAAAELVDQSPEAARTAMHEVQAVGAATMAEMHHLLALTRAGDHAGRRPQPGVDDVHDLIAAEQAAGRPVSLTITGTPRELPRGLALSIYRIVQESLTNVRKHAEHSRCDVRLTYTPDTLQVQILDDGTRTDRHVNAGFGIIGMGERARLYGGTLQAGPRPEGGWRVSATFPLEHDGVER